MKYFLLSFLLLIYFELLGRSFFACIKRKPLEFSFVIGFVLVIAVTYCLGWPITAFNGNFYHLLILYGIFFIGSIVFIAFHIKKIEWKLNYKWWILFAVLFAFQFYMSWTRTLGDLHGYDTLYYFNMISFNIGNTELNSLHPHFGTYPNTDIQWITYVFQSYYYIVAVYIYVVNGLFGLIGSTFEFVPGFYWTFQLLCNAVFISSGLLAIKEIESKNKWMNVGLVILLILFMNNFYWNNALGFIGNNFRMSLHAISTLYLFRYVKDKDRMNLYIVFITMIGMCGASSTGTFATIFLLFGLFFYLFDKEKDVFKLFAVTLLVPLINIAVVKLGQHWYVAAAIVVLCAVVYALNDWLLKLYQNRYIRYGTIILVFIVLYGCSVYTSGDVINLKYFFDNYSELQDMSWDYFYFPDLKHYLFNILLLGSMAWYFIRNRKNVLTIVSLVLIATFFNPLCSYFINSINWVYYRCYDIIINQYTIVLFIVFLYESIKKETMKKIVVGVLIVISVYLAVVQIPCYWHYSFEPDDDYNYVYKMENSELEVIQNVRSLINELNIENPKIITPTYLMASSLEDGEYMFGKEKRYNWDQYDYVSYNLYVIFFRGDHTDAFYPGDDPLYGRTLELLEECDYDILVINYDQYYRDNEGKYHPLTELVEEEYERTSASTDTYAVYYLGD